MLGQETTTQIGNPIVPDALPHHLRPITFAATELLLDLIYLIQSFCQTDLESILILLCVTDASMHPFMLDPSTPPEIMDAERPPDEVRGAISRRMVSDKTGLPRETVRRKSMELAAAGFLLIDDQDRLRIAQDLGNPAFQRTVEGGHLAVLRYLERLHALGVDWKNVPVGKP